MWLAGLLVSSMQTMELLQEEWFTQQTLTPELSFYQCHACHHPMDDLRWQPEGGAGALLQVLRENSGAINGEMLHAQVHDLVQQEAARLGYLDQKPQFAAIEDAGHENGQFVFLRPKSARL